MIHGLVKSEDVVGVTVLNTQGEDLGKVEEVVLDKHDGQVKYVVLSFGGFLGLGDKYFALPWEIFSYNEDKNSFIINVSQEKLKNSTGFDKDNWPDMTNPTWGRDIREFYGQTTRL